MLIRKPSIKYHNYFSEKHRNIREKNSEAFHLGFSREYKARRDEILLLL